MEQSFLQQGIEKARQQDYQGAIADFTQAIVMNPHLGETYYRRGLAYSNLDNFLSAAFDYTAALQSGYESLEVYYARAFVRLQLKNFPGAKEDIEKAIALNNHYAPAYQLQGIVNEKLAHREQAITAFKQAANLYLEDKDVENCRICLDKIKQLQVSVREIKKEETSSSTPMLSQAEIFTNILAKAERGEALSAIEDLNWAIKSDNNDARAYCCRGIIKSKIGDKTGAIADLNQAINLNHQDLIAYRHRGQLRHELGDFIGALADFDRTLVIDKEDENNYISRGNLRAAMGNYQGAIEDFNSAIALNNSNAKAYFGRGQAYSYQEEIKQSIADWQQAASLFFLQQDWQNYRKVIESLQKINGTSPQTNIGRGSNFSFLASYAPELFNWAILAEKDYIKDPLSCAIKIKQFAEILAQTLAEKVNLYFLANESQQELLSRLVYSGILSNNIYQIFNEIERLGNRAIDYHLTDRNMALIMLKNARELAVWFYRNFGGDRNFSPEPFIPPDF